MLLRTGIRYIVCKYMFVNENHYVKVIHHVCVASMRHRKLESSHRDKNQQFNAGLYTSCGKY